MAPQFSELVELLVEGARYDDMEDVQSALDQGTDINSQDEQGRTALHMAAANDHTDMMRYLIEKGASVRLSNVEGNTPLHWACTNGKIDAVRILLENGASASALNRHDQTPVDEALIRHFQPIVDLINEFNAPTKEVEDVEVPDDADEVMDMGLEEEDARQE